MKKFFSVVFILILSGHSVTAQEDSLKHSTCAGLNIIRIAAGDIELQLTQQIITRLAIGCAAGYDFNTLQTVATASHGADFDSTKRMESIEEASNPEGRYFYGQGPAFRFYVDYDFASSAKVQWFISTEGVLKYRNYSGKPFADKHMQLVYKESGKQTITGGSFYAGANFRLGSRLVLRTYTGIGIRILNSTIERPGWYDVNTYHPPTHFAYNLVLPALHLGLAILIRLH